MGTRSQTRIQDTQGRVLVQIYRQMDGYPSGMGKALADIMAKGARVDGIPVGRDSVAMFNAEGARVNGIRGGRDPGAMFNGSGCFAAQVVGALKGDKAGRIYLEPAVLDLYDHNYTYVITYPDELAGDFLIEVFGGSEEDKIFTGGLAEFVSFCNSEY